MPGRVTEIAAVALAKRSASLPNLPETAIQLVPTRDRAAVSEMLTMTDHIDVIVPRGGKSLIERVARQSRIPVIKHLDGVCHVYLDADADPDKARADLERMLERSDSDERVVVAERLAGVLA